MKSKLKSRKSFTLVELAMVIVIVGVLMGASSMYIKETIDLWKFLNFRNELVSQGRMGLIRMEREIRQINDRYSVKTATASEFEFWSINDTSNTMDFKVTSNNLLFTYKGVSYVLVSGISNLAFIYYDQSNNAISTPLVNPNPTDINRINITLVIQSGNQSKTLTSQIFPRNLGL